MGKLEKAIYFMCQNFSSKVDWVNRLEEVIKSSPANLAPIKTEASVTRAVVASLPPPEEVNIMNQENFKENIDGFHYQMFYNLRLNQIRISYVSFFIQRF